jgi:hypothetical protein
MAQLNRDYIALEQYNPIMGYPLQYNPACNGFILRIRNIIQLTLRTENQIQNFVFLLEDSTPCIPI